MEDVNDGEEFFVTTFDGITHSVTNIQFYEGLDLAALSFEANPGQYEMANNGDCIPLPGETVYIAGYPLQTTAVPERDLRFVEGKVIANLDSNDKNGYQLLYSNPTLPGMSGSPLFNQYGAVVAVHGRGEIDITLTEQSGLAVKTGSNQGIPYRLVLDCISFPVSESTSCELNG